MFRPRWDSASLPRRVVETSSVEGTRRGHHRAIHFPILAPERGNLAKIGISLFGTHFAQFHFGYQTQRSIPCPFSQSLLALFPLR